MDLLDIMLPSHREEFEEELKRQNKKVSGNSIDYSLNFRETVKGYDYWDYLDDVYTAKIEFYESLTDEHKLQLNSLKEDIHNKVCINFNREVYVENKDISNNIIDCFFIWNSTPEGYDFWDNEVRKLTGLKISLSEEELDLIYKLSKFINNKSDIFKLKLKEMII